MLAGILSLTIWFQRQNDGPPSSTDAPSSTDGRSGRDRSRAPKDALPLVDGSTGDWLSNEQDALGSAVVAGWLQFVDPHGEVIERIQTAVSREGWLAVPRRVALGAERFVFRPGQGGEAEVVDGIWRRGEPIGLWRIETPELKNAPPLVPWVESVPLEYLSYAGRDEAVPIPGPLRRAGLFLKGEVFDGLERGGVLLQGGEVVGWATGDPEAAMWFWTGDAGEELAPERTVAEFYRETFAGGREEALAAAHAASTASAPRVRVVAAFGDALRLRPRLTEPESRENWLPPSAVAPLLRAMRNLLDERAPLAVLSGVDEGTIETLQDGGVLLLYSDALAEGIGPAEAIALLDRWGRILIPAGSEFEEQFLARLLRRFVDAVTLAIDAGDVGGAWAFLDDGRQRFPDDPELYLTEVELWLDEGSWQQAETLLFAVTFPPKFRERVALLGRRISDLKGTEGRIVIRFRPGASSITTHADISGVRQLFIIDTGASFTSIPNSTARALGIRIDANTRMQELRTASDVIMAPVVTLAGITVGGWTVPDVEATVLDLPGHEDLGLLGLNFLGSFRLDLDRERGILTLDPK